MYRRFPPWCTALAAIVLAGCTSRPVDTPLRSLVLITIDTLRSDHLGCYGYAGRATSPRIDALAADSLVYERAYAHTPWTPPSHASILTGKLPPEHGLRQLWNDALDRSQVTIAEVVRDAGFATAAFVSAAPLRRAVGLARGFSRYDDGRVRGLGAAAERAGEKTTDALFGWLDDTCGTAVLRLDSLLRTARSLPATRGV